jgi:CDP-diacylglycerol---glycerol-3-phosphate 3-phosphatidyltransferase
LKFLDGFKRYANSKEDQWFEKGNARMLSLSNGLSFSRAPLAFLFLIDNTPLRVTAIILAMITDSIDGYFARRSCSTTRFGAILDPAMDKLFVFVALTVFLLKGKLLLWQAGAMISRDFALCIFGAYLLLSKKWKTYQCHAIRWGKITTASQFLILIGLTLNFSFPTFIYIFFIISGVFSFLELCLTTSRRLPVD